MTTELKPRIVVIGVGGAGGNAVDNMIEANLRGVEFYVANTDAQAMARSKTNNRIQLGLEATGGLGAGAKPEIGKAAAEESMEEINALLEGAHMVFVAAGMGGGTGTGAAPVIAKAAHDRGILTIGVITKPFSFEGKHRMGLADGGIEQLRDFVDTLIVVPNQNLFRLAKQGTTVTEAFRMADDVLYCGVKGITDLMVMPGLINLDFADVRTIMKGMGTAMMGMGEGEGEGRALEAAKTAVDNPLLEDITLDGARGVLINITGGYDMTLFELDEAANEIRNQVDESANIILGSTFDPEMEGRIRVSVIAAGLSPADVKTAVPAQRDKSADGPSIITPLANGTPRETEIDPRPDFRGRELPAAHLPRAEGSETVAAEAAFAKRPSPGDDGPAGFSNLFGWRREAANEIDEDAADPIISSPDDHPKPAPFDDADLEIPAFLRRSANN